MNCRLFQLALFDAVGLVDGTGNYRTRGFGCPILAPLRRMVSRVTSRRYWPANLPPPGQRASAVLGHGGQGSGCAGGGIGAASSFAMVASTWARSGPAGASRTNWRSSASPPARSSLPRKSTMPRKKWASG